MVCDEKGQVLERETDDEFGKRTGNGISKFGLSSNMYDPDTGLYYFAARWYDANTGRFIENDPVLEGNNIINTYEYCANNPTNLIDRYGEDYVDSDGWTHIEADCEEMRSEEEATSNNDVDYEVDEENDWRNPKSTNMYDDPNNDNYGNPYNTSCPNEAEIEYINGDDKVISDNNYLETTDNDFFSSDFYDNSCLIFDAVLMTQPLVKQEFDPFDMSDGKLKTYLIGAGSLLLKTNIPGLPGFLAKGTGLILIEQGGYLALTDIIEGWR